LGESNQLTKIKRLLEQILTQCDSEHIYSGTIFEFDTVGFVPKERLEKGMLVDRKEGIRRVYFEASGTSKSNIKTSLLNVGDPVIVVGRKNPLRETTTFPLLLILPERQTILISQQLNDPRRGDPGENALGVLYCILLVLGVPGYLLGPYFFPMYLNLWIEIILLYMALGILFFGIVWYQKYIRRARTIHFDSDSWTNIVPLLKNHLPVEASYIFDQE